MEKSVKVAEREYSKRMAELNRGFEVSSDISPSYLSDCNHLIVGGRQLVLDYGVQDE